MPKKTNNYGVKSGQKWVRGTFGIDRELRVMAVADGYAMVRYPSCMPFTMFCRDMHERPEWKLVRDVGEK